MRRREDDADGLLDEAKLPAESEETKFANTRGALDNLVSEVRASAGIRNNLGLKVNVALRVAESVLKRYPPPAG